MRRTRLRLSLWLGSLSILTMVSGCFDPAASPGTDGSGPRPPGIFESGPAHQLPAGTFIDVTLLQALSSASARSGDSWQGVVARPVIAFGREALPRGCRVEGRVIESRAAAAGKAATLQLMVTTIYTEAASLSLSAVAHPVIAGSTRARDIGAITGGTAEASMSPVEFDGGRTEAVAVGAAAEARAAGAEIRRAREAVISEGAVMTFVASRTIALK